MLIIHEIMGRHCGWLAAETTRKYVDWVGKQTWAPALGLSEERWSPHALYLPEIAIDIDGEAERLKAVMDEVGNVNIFLSEGAGVPEILAQMEERGETIVRDPFGHVRLDEINPGLWFARQFSERLGAEKVMVQKSGYFARSAKANKYDLHLIQSMVDLAVDCAMRGESGVIGNDEENGDKLSAIAFPRIEGGKAFDISVPWFETLMSTIGQPFTAAKSSAH
jgi:6-phosphofructokinase